MAEDLSRYNADGTLLRKAQLKMLDIMVEVDKIFRRHGIDYFLDGGTLLGAVRHGGFIPWDDDLDIAVRWKDMPKIRKVLSEELPDNLVFHDVHNDWNYHLLLAKVHDRNSLFNDGYNRRWKYRGIYIDIIPMEEVVSFKIKDKIDFVYLRCLRGIHNYSDRFIEKFLGYVCYIPSVCAAALCRLWTRVFPSHKWGHAYGWLSYSHIDEQAIFPSKDITFEGKTLRGPHDADKFLSTLFGDYMKVPPEEQRKTHEAEIEFYK